MGLLFIAFACLPIAAALGVLGRRPDDAPPWVLVATGLVFALAGCAIIVGYAVAPAVGPDGQLDPSTPFGVQVLQFLLGIGFVISLVSVFAWVAFGGGPRNFTSSVSLPIGTRVSHGDERSGRIAFGVAAILGGLMAVATIVWGVKLFTKARSASRRLP
jgi:hypothetical protein